MAEKNLIGMIHSFESFGTLDGPGIRSVVFLQGCRLRCLYCHNPDTWSEKSGSSLSVEALLNKILRYKSYFEASGGGVTVSGGEPLLQAEFVAELFHGLKKEGIHTCLDTAGDYPDSLDNPVLEKLLSVTDLVLLDIKHTKPEKHKALTGRCDLPSLLFASLIEKRHIPMWLRYVVLPGYTDSPEDIMAFKNWATRLSNVQKTEFLPFHKMGEYKWKALNLPYSLSDVEPPSDAFMQKLSLPD